MALSERQYHSALLLLNPRLQRALLNTDHAVHSSTYIALIQRGRTNCVSMWGRTDNLPEPCTDEDLEGSTPDLDPVSSAGRESYTDSRRSSLRQRSAIKYQGQRTCQRFLWHRLHHSEYIMASKSMAGY